MVGTAPYHNALFDLVVLSERCCCKADPALHLQETQCRGREPGSWHGFCEGRTSGLGCHGSTSDIDTLITASSCEGKEGTGRVGTQVVSGVEVSAQLLQIGNIAGR